MDNDALASGNCNDSIWGYDDESTLTRECNKFLQKNHNNIDEHQLLYDGMLLPKTNSINRINQHHMY